MAQFLKSKFIIVFKLNFNGGFNFISKFQNLVISKSGYKPGPASSVVERSLRKLSSEGTAVRNSP